MAKYSSIYLFIDRFIYYPCFTSSSASVLSIKSNNNNNITPFYEFEFNEKGRATYHREGLLMWRFLWTESLLLNGERETADSLSSHVLS